MSTTVSVAYVNSDSLLLFLSLPDSKSVKKFLVVKKCRCKLTRVLELNWYRTALQIILKALFFSYTAKRG